MVRKVRIPKLSANIVEVAVTAWLKNENDSIRKGEPLVELTTDKAVIEFESPCSGVVRSILAKTKSTLPVGYVIALVGGKTDPLPDVSAENEQVVAQQHQSAQTRRRTRGVTQAQAGRRRVRATPAARRLARELGVELTELQDMASGETISEQMVRDHVAKQGS